MGGGGVLSSYSCVLIHVLIANLHLDPDLGLSSFSPSPRSRTWHLHISQNPSLTSPQELRGSCWGKAAMLAPLPPMPCKGGCCRVLSPVRLLHVILHLPVCPRHMDLLPQPSLQLLAVSTTPSICMGQCAAYIGLPSITVEPVHGGKV